jgi:excisionase family DNA binding protein
LVRHRTLDSLRGNTLKGTIRCVKAPLQRSEPWLTTDEYAEVLRVAPLTVRRNARELGGLRVGRLWRFPIPRSHWDGATIHELVTAAAEHGIRLPHTEAVSLLEERGIAGAHAFVDEIANRRALTGKD